MNMRDHEIELIAAFAEGRLQDESEARALIESSEEARAEYVAQQRAIDALRSAGPVEMTEHERAALHRDVWTALRAEAGDTGRERSPWYLRWSYVAAGLFVVVGLVSVLSQGGMDDSGDLGGDSTEMASDGVASTLAESDSSDTDRAGDDSAEGSTAGDTDSITEESDALQAAPAIDTGQLEEFAARLREGEIDEDALSSTGEGCLDRAGLEEHRLVAELDLESRYLVAVPGEASIDAETTVTFVDGDTCEVVFIDR